MQDNNDPSEIVELYQKYVSAPKAQFFKQLGLDVVQGKRDGLYLETVASKDKPSIKLLDCRTSGGVFNLGHQHPTIVQAMKAGLDAGLDIGDHHLISRQRSLLAQKLANLLPEGISKTQFCGVGGEAVDLALKLARGYTKRQKIVSATTAYHGVTGMSLAAGDNKFNRQFLLPSEVEHFVQVPFGDIESMEEVLDENTAAVILETIPATGGILVAEETYFTRIREICDDLGIVMIADEVQTGLGRTGELWGISGGLHPDHPVIPDIIVLAKGMSAGYYPMATCSYKPFLEKVFEEDPFLHISTTGGSELGCHITSTMLDIVSDQQFLDNVNACGEIFHKGLLQLKEALPFVVDIRGSGLMWGIEFSDERLGPLYTVKMVEQGIFADYCGNQPQTVKIMPPLIVTPDIVEEILEKLTAAGRAMGEELSR